MEEIERIYGGRFSTKKEKLYNWKLDDIIKTGSEDKNE